MFGEWGLGTGGQDPSTLLRMTIWGVGDRCQSLLSSGAYGHDGACPSKGVVGVRRLYSASGWRGHVGHAGACPSYICGFGSFAAWCNLALHGVWRLASCIGGSLKFTACKSRKSVTLLHL